MYGQAHSLADRSRILSEKGKAGEKKKKNTGSRNWIFISLLADAGFGVLSSFAGGKPVHFDRICQCMALLHCSMLQPYALK